MKKEKDYSTLIVLGLLIAAGIVAYIMWTNPGTL